MNSKHPFDNPDRLHNLFTLKKGCAILCDIDGTLTEHQNVPDYSKDLVLLDGSLTKLNEWYQDSAYVVLTTSRNEEDRNRLELALDRVGIRYDQLIMGLPPGPRYLINDKKPYSKITMAKSFEVKRDEGIKVIGHSFAAVNIRENTVEKTIPKDASETQLNKFAWQYMTLSELKSIESVSRCVPGVHEFTQNRFTMDYLEEHRGVNTFDSKQRNQILPIVFENLSKIYAIQNEDTNKQTRDWDNWFFNFIEKKIYVKKEDFRILGLNTDSIDRFEKYLNENYEKVRPTFFAKYFHGDLTYENILFSNFDVKFIDFDNDHSWGPVELDLGKLTQSIITKYESWSDYGAEIEDTEEEFQRTIDFFSRYVGTHAKEKAYFYCIIHLVRMVPYQAQHDIQRCHTAIRWIETLFDMLENK